MNSVRAAVLLVLVTLMCGCSRPTSYERFVLLGDKEGDGRYHYTLDMSDSLCTYDISFYTRIDSNGNKLSGIKDFPLNVTFMSPSGQRYEEKVYFKVNGEAAAGSDFYSRQYKVPYRSGLVPVEWGMWEMAVRIDSDRYIPGFRGLGVICKKNI